MYLTPGPGATRPGAEAGGAGVGVGTDEEEMGPPLPAPPLALVEVCTANFDAMLAA